MAYFATPYTIHFDDTMAYFATPYTIHFDDTMAYGSHHFLTSFKFQCAARESFLFGERVFDSAGVRDCLDRVQLLTGDAYARNLNPAKLGDRIAILLTLEEWGRVSARFCYRVISENGRPICAGFQTLICAASATGTPVLIPDPLRNAMDQMRDIEEPNDERSFRDNVLAGGDSVDGLFPQSIIATARNYLKTRYPSPDVIHSDPQSLADEPGRQSAPQIAHRYDRQSNVLGVPAADDPDSGAVAYNVDQTYNMDQTCNGDQAFDGDQTLDGDQRLDGDQAFETWVFSGQGSFDAQLLSDRVRTLLDWNPTLRQNLERCASIAAELIGGDAHAIVSGSAAECGRSARETPGLMQVAIYLQNVLGAELFQMAGHRPRLLMGHSFGEIAALTVAGSFDLATGVEAVCNRVLAVANHAPDDGGLLVVGSNRQVVASEAAILGLDEVVVAGRNHEEQTVASGPAPQLDQLRECCSALGIQAIKIPSPTSFHHPRLRDAARQWHGALRRLSMKPPQRAVYSPIGRRYVSPSADIPATLASQFVRPFDFQGALQDVVASGGGRFVDCGSTGSLKRLLEKAGPDGIEVSSATSLRKSRTADDATDQRSPMTAAEKDLSTARSPPSGPFPPSGPYPPSDQYPPSVLSSRSKLRSQAQETSENQANTMVPTIAILGQGCILPGGATTPRQLLTAIQEQRLGIVDQGKVDPHWMEDFYSETLVPDRSTSPLTGLVNHDDIVVPQGVAPEVFDTFTRAQRLLCIALAPCVDSLKNVQRILCFVGATADGFEDQDEVSSLRYAGIDPTDTIVDGYFDTVRSAFEEPHAAVQEVFDRLVRPGLNVTLVDAACASSLYAVALGMQALESFETDAVIAGGVFCPGPGNNCLFSQFRGTTSTGCRPFDANADGVVFSEGSAMIVLRRLQDAEADGAPISAVVRGIGLSSDGKSSSANVPQTRGQILALKRCYENYGIDPSTVQAIEAHGTSTPVGDSTEIETLHEFFAGRTDSPIPVHSLKGLLGHGGWAAGTASLIAACQYLQAGTFPGQAFFSEPSDAVRKAGETLRVSATAATLPDGDRRIAVDGFGFGGANAHVVVDHYRAGKSPNSIAAPHRDQPGDEGSELVIVGVHQIQPTVESPTGKRFDRDKLELPKRHLLLPDLADDMDVSQRLAITLVDQVIDQIPQFDDEMKMQTSVVLAQSGKTERGVEATMRVLGPRFCRYLSDSVHAPNIDDALDRARPSGPYTLQCMMPNVSSGRAALQMNLNGPNFVVDSGQQSLAAAVASAGLLLRSGDEGGTKLAVVAAINANPYRVPDVSETLEGEWAAAFAVTTRRYAEQYGLTVRSTVQEIFHVEGESQTLSAQLNLAVQTVEKSVRANERRVELKSEFPVYSPIWVESPGQSNANTDGPRFSRLLAIARADDADLATLPAELSKVSEHVLVLVVGPRADEVVAEFAQDHLVAVCLSNEQSVASALARAEEVDPQGVVTIGHVESWDLESVLTTVATANQLCECLFLVARRFATKIEQGSFEIWGLCLGGWNNVVHPSSGALVGTLKAIGREMPQSRVGVVATRCQQLSTGIDRWMNERSQSDHEPEIVYDGALRLVRRLRQCPQLDPNVATPQVELCAESVVVATGGARGVTAVMIDALLRDYGCQVIALGRSPLEVGPADPDSPAVEREYYQRYLAENPDRTLPEMKKRFVSTRARWEAHQTLQDLATLGGRVHYIQVDVTDLDQVQQAVQKITDRFGRIDLLVHGAGVQYSKRLKDRSLEEFRRTYRVKVAGLNNMVTAIRERFGKTVSTHILTSAYSVFGNDGQHDYGAANETMDRVCGLTETESSHDWRSIAWLAWDGVGMTRGSEYRVLAAQRGLSGLTPQSGQRVFREVFEGQTGAAINVPVSAAEHLKYQVPTVPPANVNSTGSPVREIPMRLSDIPCIPFHVVDGIPTLPGAWTLDRMVQAALPLANNAENTIAKKAKAVTLRDVVFSRFVRCVNNNEPKIRVVAEESIHGIDVWVIGDVLHSSGATLARDVIFSQATLFFHSESKSQLPTPLDVGNPVLGSQEIALRNDPYCFGQSVDLSGPFDCIRDIEIGGRGRRARFEPDASCNWDGKIPAMLIDAALRVGAMYADDDRGSLFVPVRIGELWVPLGMNAGSSAAYDWEIKSGSPTIDGHTAIWRRTEVINGDGSVALRIENALAKEMPPRS